MLEPEEIVEAVIAFFAPKVLVGQGADDGGPTFEAIDPVRGITNLSSGRMGYAVARRPAGRGRGDAGFRAGRPGCPAGALSASPCAARSTCTPP